MLEIRRMLQSDIGFARSLTDIEQWGHLQADFNRLLRLDSEGCFVAWQDDVRAGIATTVRYDRYAFLGNIIVKREYRGGNIGPALMRHGVNYLEKQDVQTIELDGVLSAVAMYRHMGFQDKYRSLRFVRNPAEIARDVQAFSHCEASVNDLTEFDFRRTNIHRQGLIREIIQENPNRALCAWSSHLQAYALVRDRANDTRAIGPLVAEDPDACDSIIATVISSFGDRTLAIGVPEINNEAVSVMKRYGFYQCAPSLRMYRGPRFDYEGYIYGIVSADVG